MKVLIFLTVLNLLSFCLACGKNDDVVTVATWNVMRQPWLPQWEELVNKNIVQKDVDILHLVEVWEDAEAEKILARKDVSSTYPYHYRAQKRNEGKCGCGNNEVFTQLGAAFLSCVIATGTNPREIIQPSTGPVAQQCFEYGIQMALYNPANVTDGFLCLACIINSAQNYIPGVFGVEEIMAQCNAGNGPLYAYGGESGHLILSKCPPDEAPEEELEYAWLSNRINIYATFGGLKIGFAHFAYNLLADVYPPGAPLMFGATQVQQATHMIAKNPDLIVGDLNTGSNYQPEGYNLLLQNYDATFETETNTYCPVTSAGFQMCTGVSGQAIDHVLMKKGLEVECTAAELFNEKPLMSDHIGVKATLLFEDN